MTIPTPPEPKQLQPGPLERAPSRPEPRVGWRVKDKRDGYVIWARVENGVERLWVVPTGV